VELSVVHRRRGVAEVVVGSALCQLAELVRDAPGVLLHEEPDGMPQARALLFEAAAVLGDVDRGHLSSSPAMLASARRRSISSGPRPASATVLSGEVRPETIRTSRRGPARVSARRRTTASLALPSSGAAATRTFQPAPCRPTTAERTAPGETRNVRRALGSCTPKRLPR